MGLFFFLLFLTACGGRKKLPPNPANVSTFKALNKEVENNRTKVDRLSMKVKASFDGEQSLKSGLMLKMKMDSIIWFSAAPALGIEMARGVVSADSFAFYEKLNKQYAIYGFQSFKERLNMEDVDLGQIQRLILGNIPRSITAKDYQFSVVDGKLMLLGSFKDYKETLEIHPEHFRLKKYRFEYMPTKQYVECHFYDYEEVDGEVLPGRVAIFTDDMSLELKVQKYFVNKAEDYPFSIPAHYEKSN